MGNERGYTLVITLLMITLIFVVGITLIASSVNSAKQNKQTESKYLSTQIAEMGVIYVQEKLLSMSETIDFEDFRNRNLIENEIAFIEKSIDGVEQRFKIEDFKVEPTLIIKYVEDSDGNTSQIEVEAIGSFNFKVSGNDGNKTTILEATLKVDHDSSGRENGGPIQNPPDKNEGTPPNEREGSVVIVPEGVTPEKSNKFNGNLTGTKVFEGIAMLTKADIKKDSRLYATALETSDSFKMGQNSKLFVCQNAIFNSSVRLQTNANSETRGNICGDATFKGDLDLTNGITLVVGGDLHAQKKISGNNKGEIIVFGKLEAYDGMSISGVKVCVKGEISGVSYTENLSATSCDQINKNGIYKLPNMEKDESGPNSCNSFCTAPDLPDNNGGNDKPPNNNDEIENPNPQSDFINIVEVEYK